MTKRNRRHLFGFRNSILIRRPSSGFRHSNLLVPGSEHFGFALRRESGFQVRLSILRLPLQPGGRAAPGFNERPEREPLGDCRFVADLVAARVFAAGRHPNRHVRPWRHKRAIAKGLTFRPLVETARDTLAWFKAQSQDRQSHLKAGLTPEHEAEVLAAWHKQQK